MRPGQALESMTDQQNYNFTKNFNLLVVMIASMYRYR